MNIKVIPYPQTVAVSFQHVKSRCSSGFSAQLYKKKKYIHLKTIISTFLQQHVKFIPTDGQTIRVPPLLWRAVCVCHKEMKS